MALDVVSALSADKILSVLAERLSKPLDDPFAPDIVVVPGIGVADWIQEQLSLQFGSRGIVANTKFWLPNEFNAIVSASADHGVKMPDATVCNGWCLSTSRKKQLKVLSLHLDLIWQRESCHSLSALPNCLTVMQCIVRR